MLPLCVINSCEYKSFLLRRFCPPGRSGFSFAGKNLRHYFVFARKVNSKQFAGRLTPFAGIHQRFGGRDVDLQNLPNIKLRGADYE
jgi:hypothetical protein